MRANLIQANAQNIPLADGVVQCVVTSPPYYGLRDYGVGDQLGLEPTLQEYIANMVAVFDEVWRVLRDDGTVFLNMGDSYNGSGGPGSQYDNKAAGGYKGEFRKYENPNKKQEGFKPKDLMMVPHRLAIALQERGWYVRMDNIWAKKSWMPESVKGWRYEMKNGVPVLRRGSGRSTKSHEYIFHLSKSDVYFYDHIAVMEQAKYDGRKDTVMKGSEKYRDGFQPIGKDQSVHLVGHERWPNQDDQGNKLRNRRSIWSDISPSNYTGNHFAAFPQDIPEICIKAGTSEKGQCPICGAQWVRVVNKGFSSHTGKTNTNYEEGTAANRMALLRQAARENGGEYINTNETIDWLPTCDHDEEPIPQIVLDPFSGSGTTVMMAQQLGRVGIGTDLSWDYIQLARERTGLAQMDAWINGVDATEENWHDLPMFSFDE